MPKGGNFMFEKNAMNTMAMLFCYGAVMTGTAFLMYRISDSRVFTLTGFIWLAAAVLTLFLNRKLPFENPVESSGRSLRKGQEALVAVLGAVILIAAQFLTRFFETAMLHLPAVSANSARLAGELRQGAGFFLSICIAGPIFEELVYRKVIFGNLSALLPKTLCALLSSALFSLSHMDGHLLVYGIQGLIFCGIYALSGRIRTSMAAHMLMNTVAVSTWLL